jgi:hypothetical protein
MTGVKRPWWPFYGFKGINDALLAGTEIVLERWGDGKPAL